MSIWQVHSYYLGLGVVGDSSIHLLVNKPAGDTPAPVPYALLVDGGDTGGQKRLLDAIHNIENMTGTYDLSPLSSTMQPKLKFSAVVISHWDTDHWRGVLYAMRDDITSQKTDPKDPITNMEVSFFQYDNTVTPRTPRTILYAPAFGIPTKGARIDPRPATAAVANANFVLGAGSAALTIVENAVRVRMEPVAAPQNVQPSLIGTNLVTGTDLTVPTGRTTVQTYQALSRPADLVAANPPAQGQPGIYVVGVSKRVIGPPQGFEIVDDLEGTAKNESSLACMIIWPGQNGAAPRLSQYFAGDMHWQEENSIVSWTGTDGTRAGPGTSVTTVKASHHGSKSSTPVRMVSMFNPRNLVACTAERNGHPSWELMLYVEGWMCSNTVANAGHKPLLTTQFPYYLLQQQGPNVGDALMWLPFPKNSADQMSMANLTSTGSVAKTYRAALTAAYVAASAPLVLNSGVTLLDPVADWLDQKNTWEDLDAKDWVRTRIAASWGRISPVPPTAHAGVGVARQTAPNKLVSDSDRLLWFRVDSQDNDNDGTVRVRYQSSVEDTVLWPDPNAIPPTTVTLPIANTQAIAHPISTYPADEVTEPNVKKQKTSTYSYSVVQSQQNWYSASSGTNPNELFFWIYGNHNPNPQEVDAETGSKASQDGSTDVIPQAPLRGDAPPLASPYYFICSSIVQYSTPPGPEVKVLANTDGLNPFLSVLHMRGLVLADTPTASVPVALHAQDEFQGWLVATLGLGASADKQPGVQVLADPTTGDVDAFTFTMPALGRTYTSAATITSLQVGSDWGLGPASTVPGQNSLILGLQDATQSTGLSLIDILAPASTRGAALPALQLLQLALGDKLRFNLDTSDGSRNALWFEPMQGYKTTLRTQYLADGPSITNMNSWIGSFLNGFSINSIKVITKLQCGWVCTAESLGALNEWEFIFTTSVGLDGVDVQPIVTFDFAGTVLNLELQFNYVASVQGSLLGQIMAWIGRQKPLAGLQFDFEDMFNTAGSNFDLPLLRRIMFGIALDANGLPTGQVENVRVDLELGVNFGQSDDQTPEKVVFLFTYTWISGQGSKLRGSLWTPPPPAIGVDDRLLPEYEPYETFEPSSINDGSTWAACLNLANLIPSDPKSPGGKTKVINIPDGVPTEVFMAALELSSTSISFEGAIECGMPQSDVIPKFYLARLSLDASYDFTSSVFSLNFDFGAAMNATFGAEILPIELVGRLSYDTQAGFDVAADVDCPGMQGAHFLDFFDSTSAPAATALIQHIELLHLHLEYQYQNTGGSTNPAKRFDFSGALLIGKLELDLAFSYTGQNTWSFTASVGAGSDQCTVQEILDSIAGDGSVNLPSCVGNILVGKPNTQAAEGDKDTPKDLVDILVKRLDNNANNANNANNTNDPTAPQTVLFTVSVNVGPVSFTFLQFRDTTWDPAKTPSKRFLRLACHGLPSVEVPVIGDLTQPFDEMYFMWVQDASNTTAKGSPPGLTKAEVALLNKELGDDPIYYKLTKDASDYQDGDVIVEAGCHFVIVMNGQGGSKDVVLDYVFAKPTPEEAAAVPPPTAALKAHARHQRKHGPNSVVRSRPLRVSEPERDGAVVLGGTAGDPAPSDETAADAGGGTTKAPLDKSIGPFSISNIGLKFTNSTLSVCLDAKVAIGPIGLSMMGFSIDMHFGGQYDLQNNFPTPLNGGIGVSLQGMVVSFDKPPVTIAGGLFQENLPQGTYYAGGVDIGFVPWAFLAAGGYGNLKDPKSGHMFKSAFVFAKLEGPLITLEFATISGVTGGFGYNSALKLPTIAEVPSFPFISMPPIPSVTGDPTMDTILALVGGQWFSPVNDSFWVGAGLTVSAFQMLDITAVAVVEWDTGVRVGIYAVAVADVPSSDAEFKLAHVELGLMATIDMDKGIALFEAQLSPSSYILDPLCHLSGGFALYYWFKDGTQQTKGDWVFTIGGYHRDYQPPPQYPNPPRLQIAWSLGPISITGQSYFAITPNVAMAGVMMHASLSLGVLEAFFDAYADFLINFKPFTFLGGGGVSVGVRFSLDLWFVTIHISVEIGATLVIQGPPISGTCHVDFWVFGFDINFGSSQKVAPAPISLLDFYDLVQQKGGPGATSVAPVPQLFACKSGLLPTSGSNAAATARLAREGKALQRAGEPAKSASAQGPGGDDAQVWAVHAGTFSFTIATVFALSTVTVYPGTKAQQSCNPPSTTANIFSRPMYLRKDQAPITSNLEVTITLESDPGADYEPQWKLQPVVSNAPRALWDACKFACRCGMTADEEKATAADNVCQTTGQTTRPPAPRRCWTARQTPRCL
ncbi:hypothetical protein B0T11DRAFT_268648 [Plectosphaerella cucumerina]|uniref:DUF6603 domain-containing protein n=1 Tax=Plectosphaerella cucumerina TaxID=40658 RepID=A0A8K0TQ81_9PEZI|nr:hypothetical protein B0T11DRAFT_268648 [Plectosphaerella cucumerina]